MCVFFYICLCVGMCTWVQLPVHARRGHQILCSWNCKQLWASCPGSWKLNEVPVLALSQWTSSPASIPFYFFMLAIAFLVVEMVAFSVLAFHYFSSSSWTYLWHTLTLEAAFCVSGPYVILRTTSFPSAVSGSGWGLNALAVVRFTEQSLRKEETALPACLIFWLTVTSSAG